MRRHEQTGRPLDNDTFLRHVEGLVDRVLHRLKPGPKRKKRELSMGSPEPPGNLT